MNIVIEFPIESKIKNIRNKFYWDKTKDNKYKYLRYKITSIPKKFNIRIINYTGNNEVFCDVLIMMTNDDKRFKYVSRSYGDIDRIIYGKTGIKCRSQNIIKK